jgi:hypothetical protein
MRGQIVSKMLVLLLAVCCLVPLAAVAAGVHFTFGAYLSGAP